MKVFFITFVTVLIVDSLIFNLHYFSFKVFMLCFVLGGLNSIFIDYLKRL